MPVCVCVCVWGGGVERGTRTTTRPMITAIPVIALISRIAKTIIRHIQLFKKTLTSRKDDNNQARYYTGAL